MIAYRVLPEQEVTLVWIWEKTTMAQVVECLNEMRHDPENDPKYSILCDTTQSVGYLSTEELNSLAEVEPVHHKAAIIAPDDLVFGMNRMFQLTIKYALPVKYYVFRDGASAVEWLGKKGPEADFILRELEKAPPS